MEVIIAAIIGAVITGFFCNLERVIQTWNTLKVQRDLARAIPESNPEFVQERHVLTMDIQEDGSCSLIRTIELLYKGSGELSIKKFGLRHQGIEPYAKKRGLELNQLLEVGDKEFQIQALDKKTMVKLASWTFIEGQNKDVFMTTVRFDNPLTPENPRINLEIRYRNLDVSFFWKKLWETEGHQDEWFEAAREPIGHYEAQILFPEKLPSWFRKTEIGTSTVPANWATVTKDIFNSRRRILIQADNLESGCSYSVKIDAGEYT